MQVAEWPNAPACRAGPEKRGGSNPSLHTMLAWPNGIGIRLKTGRGSRLKPCFMGVRIPPPVPRTPVSSSRQGTALVRRGHRFDPCHRLHADSVHEWAARLTGGSLPCKQGMSVRIRRGPPCGIGRAARCWLARSARWVRLLHSAPHGWVAEMAYCTRLLSGWP